MLAALAGEALDGTWESPEGAHAEGSAARSGSVASTVGGADAAFLGARGIVGTDVFGQSHPDRLGIVLGMAADGTLEVPITRRFSFRELPQALGLVGERRSRGKFAVTISS